MAIESFVREKLRWIHKRLTHNRAIADAVCGLNALTEIRLDGKTHAAAECIKGRGGRRAMIQKVYSEAFVAAGQRVVQLAKAFGFTYSPPVRSSNAKTSWGSCSTNGIIRLNWRIVMLPEHLRDYIILHELTHTVHPNHSKAFWSALKAILPDCTERRTALKAHGCYIYAYR